MAIVVGDIHGNVEKVKAFLAYRPEEDHVALGDYLDSFNEQQPRQIEALHLLLESKAILLWGNHDLHYLKDPPFHGTGYQFGKEKPLQELIEANKGRFLAAYAVDGWLCTHAGVHDELATTADVYELADRFNNLVVDATKDNSVETRLLQVRTPLFDISYARGGNARFSGIFWFDFKRESGLATNIKQIFGHTEIREPVVTDTYIALDTTNNRESCWLYDTSSNELIRLDLPEWKPKPQNNQPGRICDLPEEEQKPFTDYLLLKSAPFAGGYWPTDYRRWKAGVEERKQHALEHYPRERDLPEEERGAFREWMMGQTRPYVEGIPREDQDFFYIKDYKRWKAGLEPFD